MGKTRDDDILQEGGLTVRQLLAKADVLAGAAVNESQATDAMDADESQWGELAAVIPRYNPFSLLNYVELTPHLKPCIDAYSTNIDGYGYKAIYREPWMADMDGEDATKAIGEALRMERWVEQQEAEQARKAEGIDVEETEEGEVIDDDIDAKREEIKSQLQRDRFVFESWFRNSCSEMSFTHLRRIVREDIESFGWGCIELLRDDNGQLKRLAYVPGHTVRPLKNKGVAVEVVEDDSITPISQDREVMVKRRFRAYVQIEGDAKVYYKSPGDPRVISKKTGKMYDDVKALRRPDDAQKDPGEGKDAEPGNELLYIAQHDPQSPCPAPRWIGNLLAVLGVREADETNYYYLAGNSIPPALLMISGGSIKGRVRQSIESQLNAELKGALGKKKKILLVEAKSSSKPGEKETVPTMELKSLRDVGHSDALFTKYDERGADRIGASFRLPPMLRGYTPSTLNRATSYATMQFGEQQVFEPLRGDEDWIYNKYIIPEIGVRYLVFKSNSPPARSAEDLAEFIKSVAPHGGLLPYEVRELVSDVLNKPLAKIEEDYAKQPMAMTLAGFMGGGGSGEDSIGAIAGRLNGIEQKIAQIVTAELRAAGYDLEVDAMLLDLEDKEKVVPGAMPTPFQTPRKCPHCGAEYYGNPKTCPSCGASLVAAEGDDA